MSKKNIILYVVVITLLFELCSCAKSDITPPGMPSALSGAETPDTSRAPSGEDMPVFPKPEYYTGDIDPYGLMNYISTLVKYIHGPYDDSLNASPELFYFAIARAENDHRCVSLYDTFRDTGPEMTVSAEVLAEYLYSEFGISGDYLEKFKDPDYGFSSEDERYDAETDSFLYRSTWYYGDDFNISFPNTSIYIDGSDIVIKTVLTTWDFNMSSADYKLSAVTVNGTRHYRFVSADFYDDMRNRNDIILTIDGISFSAPWFTVTLNGETEYYNTAQPMDYGYETWSRPSPYLSVPPQPWIDNMPEEVEFLSDNAIGIYKCEFFSGEAYLTFVYYGVTEVYIYNLADKTGRWMSGVTSLAEAYRSEIAQIRELDAEGGQLSHYRANDVVTISQKHGYALIRRSGSAGLGMDGEYLLRDLTSGEETAICGSYTKKEMIISYMDEMFEWIDENHLRLGIVADVDVDNGYLCVYDIIFNDTGWTVSKSDEPMW